MCVCVCVRAYACLYAHVCACGQVQARVRAQARWQTCVYALTPHLHLQQPGSAPRQPHRSLFQTHPHLVGTGTGAGVMRERVRVLVRVPVRVMRERVRVRVRVRVGVGVRVYARARISVFGPESQVTKSYDVTIILLSYSNQSLGRSGVNVRCHLP